MAEIPVATDLGMLETAWWVAVGAVAAGVVMAGIVWIIRR